MSRKILFVTDSLFPLGPAQQLRILSQGLLDDFEVHIAAFNEHPNTELASLHPNVQIHGLYRGRTHGISQAILTPRLRKLIRSLRPDIVHGWCDSANAIAAFATQGVSGTAFFCTELCEQFEKPTLRKLLESRLHRIPDRITVPHLSLQQKLAEIGFANTGFNKDRYEIIPNAAGPSAITPASARQQLVEKLGIPPESKIAVAAAPLIARSRLKDLIWATDLLLCVRDDVHFVLFGKGKQEWRLRRFLSLTESMGHVHFLGEHARAHELVLGGDVFWQPHLREPLPSTLLHVMAQGIPAVTVYGPESEDIIQPQITGLPVNFGARDEFARWTKYLIELPEAANQLSEQGKQHVLECFSPQRTITAFLELYA